MPLSVLAASTAVAGKPSADRGSASHALPAATMSEAIRGSDFFGAEGGGESKYEVSHVVGKGSYGIVWCELQRPSCATATSSGSATIAEAPCRYVSLEFRSDFRERLPLISAELQNTAGFI